jgi:mono/diheme cytochrome c family protein
MIKVLVAGLIGTIVGVAVMIVVIVASGTTTSGASSVGLGSLPLSTAAVSSAPPASSAPPTSTPSGSTGGGATGNAANGKTVFTGSAGCGSCHTLAAAGTSGTIGPNLDSLAGDASKAGKPLDDFIHESIVDPSAYVASGYPDGVMPSTFGSSLSASDIADLVAFISASQK